MLCAIGMLQRVSTGGVSTIPMLSLFRCCRRVVSQQLGVSSMGLGGGPSGDLSHCGY